MMNSTRACPFMRRAMRVSISLPMRDTDGLTQIHFVQQLHTCVHRDGSHQSFECFARCAAQCRMRRENLLPCVCDRRMRVHHACGHLDQLSGMPDKQDLGIAAVRRMVERLTDEVGALDRAFKVKAERVPREIRAVVARAQERNALSLRVQAVQLQSDGVHKRLFAHRLNDAARAENRDAADDAEVSIVGLGGKCLAVLHRMVTESRRRIRSVPRPGAPRP